MSLDYKQFPLVDFYNRKVKVILPDGPDSGLFMPEEQDFRLMGLDGNSRLVRREDILQISLVS